MNGIMHRYIYQIANYKAREVYERIATLSRSQYRQAKNDHENKTGKEDTWNWRHKEPFLIPGIFVVVAMKNIDDLLSEFGAGFVVKKEAMGYVFKQRPAKHGCKKQQSNESPGIAKPDMAVIKHVRTGRNINSINDPGPRFSKAFQKAISEEPCLTFIVNLIEMHDFPLYFSGLTNKKAVCFFN